MTRGTALAIAGLIVWICWCVLVIAAIVPAVRRTVTMWPGFLAYVFCVLPVFVVAAIVLMRLRRP